MRKSLRGLWVFLCLVACPVWVHAQKLPWEEYDRLVEKGRSIAPLSADTMFGDSVDLYTGALSFVATDVSLPGNNALSVAVGRRLAIADREGYPPPDYPFADWDLDVPSISAVFSASAGDPTWCSTDKPPTISLSVDADNYWSGNQANMPGGGEMLRNSITRPAPSSGGPYRSTVAAC